MTDLKTRIENDVSGFNWFAKQRLKFIDTRLFGDGYVSRKDLCEYFGIAEAQATRDLTLYRAKFKQNIKYNGKAKRYERTTNYAPVLHYGHDAEDIIRSLEAKVEAEWQPIETIPYDIKVYLKNQKGQIDTGVYESSLSEINSVDGFGDDENEYGYTYWKPLTNTALQTKLTEADKLLEVMGEAYKRLLYYSVDILSMEGLEKGQLILAQYQSYKAGRE